TLRDVHAVMALEVKVRKRRLLAEGIVVSKSINEDFIEIEFSSKLKNGKRWCLNNGERIRDTLIKITRQKIEEANQLTKVDGKIMSVIRLGLSSIIDLSSEFDGGMHTWFGDEWEGLKAKASEKISFEICASYRYWDARSYLLDKLKERPDDDKHRQVLKIYFYLGETIPRPTVNRKIDLRVLSIGNNVDLSHSEFACKATPIKIIKDR
ncbi:26942_t:CDS:2, partial [Dentiscutata erythropus]